MKKVYIKTLGCEKNTVDSQCAMAILENNGCTLTDDPLKADVLMVNTCGFILDAKQQSIEEIFNLIDIKTADQKLIVSGCLSQRYGEELAKELPEVDCFIGVNDYEKIADIVNGKEEARVTLSDYCPVYRELPRKADGSYTACIKISEGCNNICSYCAIPFMRGKYRSRKEEDIVKEAENLAKNGVKELVVIGQDVTYYGRDFNDKDALPRLLHKLCRIDAIHWIRIMYCYEDEITDGLIECIKEEDKICKYIDIPLQHYSDKILKAMNRKSTGKTIESTINKLRKQVPGIIIRTTFMTGFPGEHKEDFKQLYDFAKKAQFDRLGVFAYSKEEGTRAAKMQGQVKQDAKERRRDKLMALQNTISLKHNQELVGKTFEVLVDEQDSDNTYIGRTYMDAPDIDNAVVFTSSKKLNPGDFVNVLINDAFDYDLSGEAIFYE